MRPLVPDSNGVPALELEVLTEAVRHAFGLARSGARALGYRYLCERRDEVLAAAAAEPWREELEGYWNTALDWYESRLPPASLG